MRSNQRIETPLLALLRALGTKKRRDEFAAAAGTTEGYLYQLAGCSRKHCRAALCKAIADTSIAFAKKYKTPAISMDDLATMCPVD